MRNVDSYLSLHGANLSLSGSLAFQQIGTIAIHLDLGDGNLAGIDSNEDSLAIDLFALNALNVDDPAAAVDLDNLTLTSLVGSPGDNDLIVLADGEALNVVFGAELLGKGSSHHLTTNVGGGREVSLAALATGRAHV